MRHGSYIRMLLTLHGIHFGNLNMKEFGAVGVYIRLDRVPQQRSPSLLVVFCREHASVSSPDLPNPGKKKPKTDLVGPRNGDLAAAERWLRPGQLRVIGAGLAGS